MRSTSRATPTPMRRRAKAAFSVEAPRTREIEEPYVLQLQRSVLAALGVQERGDYAVATAQRAAPR